MKRFFLAIVSFTNSKIIMWLRLSMIFIPSFLSGTFSGSLLRPSFAYCAFSQGKKNELQRSKKSTMRPNQKSI